MKNNTVLLIAGAAAVYFLFLGKKGTDAPKKAVAPIITPGGKTVYPDYASAAKVAPAGAGVAYSSDLGGYTLIPASQMIPGSTVPLAGTGDEVIIDIPRQWEYAPEPEDRWTPSPPDIYTPPPEPPLVDPRMAPGAQSIWWGYMD